MNILCLDIGSGTQDVLYFQDHLELENCPKFILPSPAANLSQKIHQLTTKKKDIYLYGENMGGSYKFALKNHIQNGLQVFIHQDAYFSLGDDLEKVKKLGVQVTDAPPKQAVPVFLTDFDPGFWTSFLKTLDLDYPDLILACAQDHGFFPGQSNRKGRFELWKQFINFNANIYSFLYSNPPQRLTRLTALKQKIGQGYVADTGVCAILGGLFDPDLDQLQKKQGICIINVGNSHVLAFLIYQDQIYGIYEHHTKKLSAQAIWDHLQQFKQGTLSNQEVFASNGHGCMYRPFLQDINFQPTFVLGPQRKKLAPFHVTFLCPGGDMMLAGCFGLLKAYWAKTSTQ